MGELVDRARDYATQAHRRIGHRRKYTQQPYEEHLRAVAALVASVTDDEPTIAAAWLHDVVEDTPATFADVEREFGSEVAQLVAEVTDVSRPGDGNRARRKSLDREHLARASARGQTIKLADLIENCRDIARNDPRFARTFVEEAGALLAVLDEGEPALHERARRTVEECAQGLEPVAGGEAPASAGPWTEALGSQRALRLFVEAFHVEDVAEPLRSFDAERPAAEVAAVLAEQGCVVAGVRRAGRVEGYVLVGDLEGGTCGDHLRAFAPGQRIEGEASLSALIHVLTLHEHAFVSLLGEVAGVATRAQIQKPVVRMWLFGMITLVEMMLVDRIRARWPGESWTGLVPEGRLAKATALRDERSRRGQGCELLDCLQLSDKAYLLMEHPDELSVFGFASRKAGKRAVKELESLRNNLAHAQDIVTHDWPQIARMTQRIELAYGLAT